jgi:hypothetical protein
MNLITRLKESDQDYEFYPTTNEIIASFAADVKSLNDSGHFGYRGLKSIIDIGAGHGKVLAAIKKFEDAQDHHSSLGITDYYAIEKSQILCSQLPDFVTILGTDFEEQSLITKSVGIIFCNPPYSVFAEWVEKIILESYAKIIYFVIPKRWEDNHSIKNALEARKATCNIVGSYDFEDAEDRKARAKVHLLRIGFSEKKSNPFDAFFEQTFSKLYQKAPQAVNEKLKREKLDSLVLGEDYPSSLVHLYNLERENVQKNYEKVGDLDPDLLKELEICPQKIRDFLYQRLIGLKVKYWRELFSRLTRITNRLTHKSREAILRKLNQNCDVDFTLNNITAVLGWVLKNSNQYIDDQVIEVFERMVDKCNVTMYKSNHKTWECEHWRYADQASNNSHYKLDYRIVTHRIGGISNSSWDYDKGLKESAALFLGDLQTVANNLGFTCENSSINRKSWTTSDSRDFFYKKAGGESEILFSVRAYLNGNLHIKLNQSFILALNVEFGRLKGWIKDKGQAAEEMNDPKAADYFNTNVKLLSSGLFLT